MIQGTYLLHDGSALGGRRRVWGWELDQGMIIFHLHSRWFRDTSVNTPPPLPGDVVELRLMS
jgi:hypothetical protein